MTFREEDDITCVFGGQEVKGVYVNEEQALCICPELFETGIVLFQLLIAHDTFRGGARGSSEPFRGEASFKSCKWLLYLLCE